MQVEAAFNTSSAWMHTFFEQEILKYICIMTPKYYRFLSGDVYLIFTLYYWLSVIINIHYFNIDLPARAFVDMYVYHFLHIYYSRILS